ncbi:NADH-ubiquinone oxidoreductase subunit [Rhodotorula toruloides]|uniref:NADH-ubiquinone oxidoreductase subunit n=1 Tax=Rhodotorula toruloides TaxID=5286 RepID=A0A511KDT1_RHOTO|nr:NADH-ubiquinone oxidoreductase subunit [Rhodotorula toruloides]
MGGSGGYQPVKIDPGVEAFAYMRENVWRHFRFTNRTAGLAAVWGVLVPSLVYLVCNQQDLKWDLTAARRDDPIARWGKYAQRPSERAAAAAPAEDE